mgnify:CR=1 FL=1|jgi:hypothetical protein
MSATITRISWVIILLVIWKVLMNRISSTSYFRIASIMKNTLRNLPGGYIAMAKRYRTMASRASDSDKKNEYLKKAEEMENKDKQQKELRRERDANNTVNAANSAREEPSLDWRGQTTSPQQRVNDAMKNAMRAVRAAR